MNLLLHMASLVCILLLSGEGAAQVRSPVLLTASVSPLATVPFDWKDETDTKSAAYVIDRFRAQSSAMLFEVDEYDQVPDRCTKRPDLKCIAIESDTGTEIVPLTAQEWAHVEVHLHDSMFEDDNTSHAWDQNEHRPQNDSQTTPCGRL